MGSPSACSAGVWSLPLWPRPLVYHACLDWTPVPGTLNGVFCLHSATSFILRSGCHWPGPRECEVIAAKKDRGSPGREWWGRQPLKLTVKPRLRAERSQLRADLRRVSWAEGTACMSSRKRRALDSPQGPTGRGTAWPRPGEGGVAVRSLDLVLEEFKWTVIPNLCF